MLVGYLTLLSTIKYIEISGEGGGATVTLVLIYNNKLYMANVGRLLDPFGGTAATIDLIYNNKLYIANVGKLLDHFINNKVYRNIRGGGGLLPL